MLLPTLRSVRLNHLFRKVDKNCLSYVTTQKYQAACVEQIIRASPTLLVLALFGGSAMTESRVSYKLGSISHLQRYGLVDETHPEGTHCSFRTAVSSGSAWVDIFVGYAGIYPSAGGRMERPRNVKRRDRDREYEDILQGRRGIGFKSGRSFYAHNKVCGICWNTVPGSRGSRI